MIRKLKYAGIEPFMSLCYYISLKFMNIMLDNKCFLIECRWEYAFDHLHNSNNHLSSHQEADFLNFLKKSLFFFVQIDRSDAKFRQGNRCRSFR